MRQRWSPCPPGQPMPAQQQAPRAYQVGRHLHQGKRASASTAPHRALTPASTSHPRAAARSPSQQPPSPSLPTQPAASYTLTRAPSQGAAQRDTTGHSLSIPSLAHDFGSSSARWSPHRSRPPPPTDRLLTLRLVYTLTTRRAPGGSSPE